MKSAVISACEKFRYRLDRDVDANLYPVTVDRPFVIAFFGVNPSTADGLTDDATVRKWMKFATREGATRFIVGNVFSYRSTDPKALARVAHTQGPQHWEHLNKIIKEADMVIPCWGSRDKVPKKLHHEIDNLFSMLVQSRKPFRVFGMTKTNDPAHPLFLPDNTPLVGF